MLLVTKNWIDVTDNIVKKSLKIVEQLNNRANTARFSIFWTEVWHSTEIKVYEILKPRKNATSWQKVLEVQDTFEQHHIFRSWDELIVDIMWSPYFLIIDSIDHELWTVTFTENLPSAITKWMCCGILIFAGTVEKNPNEEIWQSGEFQRQVNASDRTPTLNRKNIVDTYEEMYIREIVWRMIHSFCANDSEAILETFESAWTASWTALSMQDENTDRIVGSNSQKTWCSGAWNALRTKTIDQVDINTMTDIRLRHKIEDWVQNSLTSMKIRIWNDSSNYFERTSDMFWKDHEDCRNYESFKINRATETWTVNKDQIDRLQIEIVSSASVAAWKILFDQMIVSSWWFTLNNSIRGDRKISDFRANYKKASELIEAITKRLWIFRYVDYNRDIHIFKTNTTQAPYSITDTSENYDKLIITPDISMLRNRVFVRGGEAATTVLYNQERVADGEQTSFQLDYKPKTLQVFVDTWSWYVEKTVGVENLAVPWSVDFVFNFNEKVVRNESHATLSSGDKIKLTYYPYQWIRVRVQDNASISSMKSLLWGDGIFDGPVIEDTSILTFEDARRRWQAEVNAYSNPIISVKFETDVSWLHAWQIIRVTDTDRWIDDDFLIQKIQRRIISGGAESIYTVECWSTMFWLIEFFQLLLKKSTDLSIDDSEIIDIVENQDETITISDSLSTTVKNSAVQAALTMKKNYDFAANYWSKTSSWLIVESGVVPQSTKVSDWTYKKYWFSQSVIENWTIVWDMEISDKNLYFPLNSYMDFWNDESVQITDALQWLTVWGRASFDDIVWHRSAIWNKYKWTNSQRWFSLDKYEWSGVRFLVSPTWTSAVVVDTPINEWQMYLFMWVLKDWIMYMYRDNVLIESKSYSHSTIHNSTYNLEFARSPENRTNNTTIIQAWIINRWITDEERNLIWNTWKYWKLPYIEWLVAYHSTQNYEYNNFKRYNNKQRFAEFSNNAVWSVWFDENANHNNWKALSVETTTAFWGDKAEAKLTYPISIKWNTEYDMSARIESLSNNSLQQQKWFYEMDGVDWSITFDSTITFDSNQIMTFAFWVNFKHIWNTDSIFRDVWTQFRIRRLNDDFDFVLNSFSWSDRVNVANVFQTDERKHIICEYDWTKMNVYMDNVLKWSVTPWWSYDSFILYGVCLQSADQLNWKLHDIRIYKESFDAAWRTKMFEWKSVWKPLIRYHTKASWTDIFDSSENWNHWTMVGDASRTESEDIPSVTTWFDLCAIEYAEAKKYKRRWFASFDGVDDRIDLAACVPYLNWKDNFTVEMYIRTTVSLWQISNTEYVSLWQERDWSNTSDFFEWDIRNLKITNNERNIWTYKLDETSWLVAKDSSWSNNHWIVSTDVVESDFWKSENILVWTWLSNKYYDLEMIYKQSLWWNDWTCFWWIEIDENWYFDLDWIDNYFTASLPAWFLWLWVYSYTTRFVADTSSSWRRFICEWNNDYEISLEFWSSNYLAAYARKDSSSSPETVLSTWALTEWQEYFVCVTFWNWILSLYIDNVLQWTSNVRTWELNQVSTWINIWTYRWENDRRFHWKILYFRLYNKVLSSNEMTDEMNSWTYTSIQDWSCVWQRNTKHFTWSEESPKTIVDIAALNEWNVIYTKHMILENFQEIQSFKRTDVYNFTSNENTRYLWIEAKIHDTIWKASVSDIIIEEKTTETVSNKWIADFSQST